MTAQVIEAIVIFISGTATGLIAGLFGVGGSFFLVPVLGLTTSIPTEIIVGSCACQVLGPATAASLSYKPRRRDLRLPIMLLGGLVAGTIWGADVLQSLTQQSSETNDLAMKAVQGGYIFVLYAISLFHFFETAMKQLNRPLKIGWGRMKWLPPYCQLFGRNRKHDVSIVSLSMFGLGVGFLSGFLGLSGGIILVPGLHYAYGITTRQSVKMSMILVGMIAIQATIVHSQFNRIDLVIVSLLLVGGTVGAKLGAKIGSRMAGESLRHHFAWLTFLTAIALSMHALLS